jgi:predicted peptidase
MAFLFTCLLAASALADQAAHTFKRTVGEKEESIGYLLALPKGYNAKKDTKYPVLLFLHGSGERGSDINKVKVHGPPKLVEKGKDLPFIVISPQLPEKAMWNPDQLIALIDEVIKENHGDKDRVICTGLSLGGFGTWALVTKYPDRFAAAVPICGGGNPATVAAMKDVPTWVFHGDKDTAVKLEASQKMVDALKAAGGTVEFTIYEGVGHDSWNKAYDDAKLWEWMAKQKRKGEK